MDEFARSEIPNRRCMQSILMNREIEVDSQSASINRKETSVSACTELNFAFRVFMT